MSRRVLAVQAPESPVHSRTVATAGQAIRRLEEYLGGALELKTRGRRWKMRWMGQRHPSIMTATDILGRLVMYLTFDHGWTRTQVWNATGYDPGKTVGKYYGVVREFWDVPERGWPTGEVRRMLDEAFTQAQGSAA